MQGITNGQHDVTDPHETLTPERKRASLVLLSRSVAHLYALAAACARPEELTGDERSLAMTEVAELLMEAYRQVQTVPACAASVLEQCAMVSSAERAPLDGADTAMVLARSGLVINTWCTAAALLTQATEGPVTIGALVSLLGSMQPDQRYQVALIERLTATAYDSSAMRQLGTCYAHALEGFNLLELHKLIGVQDMARTRAVDLLDSASRGAVIAMHFLARTPIHEPGEDHEPPGEDHEPEQPGEEAPGEDREPEPEPQPADQAAERETQESKREESDTHKPELHGTQAVS